MTKTGIALILTLVTLIIFSMGSLVSSRSKTPSIIIRFSHVTAENTPKGWGAAEFARRVEKAFNGRVQVRVFPNGTLYPDNQAIEALAAGELEMAAPSTAKFMGMVPSLQMFDMPFLFPDIQTLHHALDSGIGEEIKTLFQERRLGIQLLAFWDNAFKHFTCSRGPLTDPAHFNGLKFRIMGADVLEAQMNALGAQGIRLPFNQVFDVLERGVVDGQENTASNIYTGGYHQVQDYITFSQHGYLGYLVIVNERFWRELPYPVREKMTSILKDVTWEVRLKAIELDRFYIRKLQVYADAHPRLHLQSLTPEQKSRLRQAVLPVYDRFSDVIPQRWLSAIRSKDP